MAPSLHFSLCFNGVLYSVVINSFLGYVWLRSCSEKKWGGGGNNPLVYTRMTAT
jgi:hypothetical protein